MPRKELVYSHVRSEKIDSKIKIINARWRNCLLRLGYPQGEKIENINFFYKVNRSDREAFHYVQCVLNIYSCLDVPLKTYMAFEVLERGYHYKYWYLGLMRTKEYNILKYKVEKVLDEILRVNNYA
ncbi:MAG: hypothetical protein K5694_01560 [Bacilli bacterium]|nr:hypothetical protein [Bacilli bacterium]